MDTAKAIMTRVLFPVLGAAIAVASAAVWYIFNVTARLDSVLNPIVSPSLVIQTRPALSPWLPAIGIALVEVLILYIMATAHRRDSGPWVSTLQLLVGPILLWLAIATQFVGSLLAGGGVFGQEFLFVLSLPELAAVGLVIVIPPAVTAVLLRR